MIARGAGGKVVTIGSLMSLLGLAYLFDLRDLEGRARTADQGAGGRSGASTTSRQELHCAGLHPLTDLNRSDVGAAAHGEVAHRRLPGESAPGALRGRFLAPLAVLLSGRGPDYITGQIIPVDGGYTTTAIWPFEP